jgi:hypothetical protein
MTCYFVDIPDDKTPPLPLNLSLKSDEMKRKERRRRAFPLRFTSLYFALSNQHQTVCLSTFVSCELNISAQFVTCEFNISTQFNLIHHCWRRSAPYVIKRFPSDISF